MASLSDIPFLSGYTQQNAINRDTESHNMRQAAGQMGLLARIQAQQEATRKLGMEEAMRRELAALGPNPTQEQATAVAMKYASPQSILTTQTSSLDRKAQMEAARLNAEAQRGQSISMQAERLAAQSENARLQREQQLEISRQRAEDQKLSAADRNQARMDTIRLAASLRAPPQPRNLQLTTDAQGNQLIVNPDGTTRPLTTEDGSGVRKTVAADKPMTEFQGKAALYGTRAAQSDKVLKALEDKISVTGLSAAQTLGTAGNFLMSSEQQRVSQAQRDFVNAVLRQESGAVISDAEFANAKKQYFPAPGDDKNVLAQKRANRQLAIQGFARMSGPKGAVDIKAILDNPLLPGVNENPVTSQESSGRIGGSVLDQADAILNRGR